MIKNASRLWGYQDTEAESSFDPLVGMILGALSGELANISGEINSAESRVVEKLVELLTPEPVTGPFPAHAIIRAKPVEPVFTIDTTYQFYVNRKFILPGEHTPKEMPFFFTPAGNSVLFNGQLKYMAAGNKIYEFMEELYKEVVAMARPGKSLTSTEIWLGLEMDDEVELLDGLSVCFDMRNEAYRESFYESLAKGRWAVNGKNAKIIQGSGIGDNTEAGTLDDLLKKELDITTKVCSHINRFYRKNFITLATGQSIVPNLKPGEKYTARFNEIFPLSDLESMEGNITWIRVELPLVLPHEVSDDLFCSINCFPVFNRHLNEFTQTSRELINIIPLTTDEVYFDMKGVTGISGRGYQMKSFTGIDEVENGSCIVRHGSVGRFDQRNAAQIVSYLQELLRDESAAFALLGTDMISSNLKELNQIITRLENRLKESGIAGESASYLLLKAHPEDEILYVEFWTTNGKFANNIKSGEKLMVYEGSDLWPDSPVFVTPTLGGCESMDTGQRVNAYRKALLSHGRVVTQEDIKALCFEHIGNRLKKVEIKKGLQTGQATNSGFTRTVDIYLTFDKSIGTYDENEQQYMKNDLLVKLEEQSMNVLPFRCFVNYK